MMVRPIIRAHLMRRIIFFCSFIFLALIIDAQRFKSEKSKVYFFSDAPVEDIEAVNRDASSAFDVSSGDIVFSVPVKKFMFDKSLMQQHFNENYMHSDKYPKIIFKGKMSKTDLKKGYNKVKVSGTMDMHGVKKKMSVTGKMTRKGDTIEAFAKFSILLKDYNIDRPQILWQNIAEEIDITVRFTYAKI